MKRARPMEGQGQNPIETNCEQKSSNVQTEEADVADGPHEGVSLTVSEAAGQPSLNPLPFHIPF